MAAAIPLRSDFSAFELRRLARSSCDAPQARRLLALATIYDGSSRSDAGRIGGVGLQIVRDWVLRFNAHGPDGLVDRHGPGARPLLNPKQLRALVEMVERGPIPAVHGVVRWRLVDLAQWIWPNGSGRSSASRSACRRSVASCAGCVIASFPHGHVIMLKLLAPLSILKKFPRSAG